MSVQRTPPSGPKSSSPLQPCISEPNLSKKQDYDSSSISTHDNITSRYKRSHSDMQLLTFMDELRDMFSTFKEEQNKKIEKIYETVYEIKNQNNEIRASVDFLSEKYDTINNLINKLESDHSSNLKYIHTLEERLDNLERLSRSTCLEIKNIPTVRSETKESLLNTVISTGKNLKVSIAPNDVKDVFRIGARDSANKTVIVELNSVLMKEKIIKMYRRSNKENNRLTTDKLKLDGPSKPIYITENLSNKMKKIYFLARDFAKSNEYKFCWISNGKIFLRKKENDRLVHIKSETDLSKLLQELKA